jgi:hypothetical protein
MKSLKINKQLTLQLLLGLVAFFIVDQLIFRIYPPIAQWLVWD